MVRLRFSTERGSLISWAIRWHTNSKFSHVEFSYDDGSTLGARFSLRGKISRWCDKHAIPLFRGWRNLDGVQLRPASENRKQTLVCFKTFDRIEDAYKWGIDFRMGVPYDLIGILGLATAEGWANRKAAFCSEFVTECANSVGVYPQNCSPQATSPRDLLISTALRGVAEVPTVETPAKV